MRDMKVSPTYPQHQARLYSHGISTLGLEINETAMTLLKRRWLTYIVVSAVFLMFYLRKSPWDTRRLPYAYTTGAAYPKMRGDTRVLWARFREKYPVKSMVSLPPGPTKPLPKVQHEFPPETLDELLSKQKPRQDAVKASFKRAWNSYRKHAWLKDELTPISGGSWNNAFGGWGATLVDSLDTLWIMDMKEEFRAAAHATSQIDFTTTEAEQINVFETTIRYLGGLLSAFELSKEPILLTKATELGNILYAAFDTPNRMPVVRWNPQFAVSGGNQEASSFSLLAELGSLTMEFTRLSQLTKDPKWYDAIHRIMTLFDAHQNTTRLPGMWPVGINTRTQQFKTRVDTFTLSATADSHYEYLPKMTALLGGGVDEMYERMYRSAMDTAIKHNLYRPMTPENADILVSGKVIAHSETDISLTPEAQHLACFAGGMFALGSRLYDIPAHMDIAHKLVDGCVWAYRSTPTNLMPEVFHMVACEPQGQPCSWDEDRYNDAVIAAHPSSTTDNPADIPDAEDLAAAIIETERLPGGISSVRDRRYILRPEAIESVFILYRITGRADLLETAWEMFVAIEEASRTEFANAGVEDVTVGGGDGDEDEKVQLTDRMESFWLAETLKYFYLIFGDPRLVSLDEFVFNTEAHPFRRG
ncbi:hypothetical protein FQN53_007890 [Emmonsiellopsis sp. PD_33]|nr:hypothetical protein FQN53_007890 [Emmonsiellopsis sp. PD_33]